MARHYFHCANGTQHLDAFGTDLEGLGAVRDEAVRALREFLNVGPTAELWTSDPWRVCGSPTSRMPQAIPSSPWSFPPCQRGLATAGSAMSNCSENDARQRAAFCYRCKHCGGAAAPVSILDSREGKTFRLLRCLTCDKTEWTEEQ